jgi:pyruvate,water dikinase
MPPGYDGPTHRPSSDRVSWTTGNVGEAVPGVLTPLTYTFWAEPFERTVRGSYAEMGVLSRAEGRRHTAHPDQIALGIVYGRAVLNVNLTLAVGAGLPGTNASEVASNVLGDIAQDVAFLPPNTPRRYPVVAIRLPVLAARLKRRMSELDDRVLALWREATTTTDARRALRLLPGIRDQFTAALTAHSHATFLSSAVYEPLSQLVGDRSDLLTTLLSGYGGMFEVQMLHQLWEVSNDKRDLDEWLSRYGYLAPYAGNLRSRSWREDSTPLLRLRNTYRSVAEADAPGAIECERIAARQAAESELVACTSALKRPGVRAILTLAAHFIPLREVGKNMYLRAVDAARAAIRLVGTGLAASGALADPDDVWFLTWDELLGPMPGGNQAVIADRRDQHRHFETLTIPDLFRGCPKPGQRETAHDTGVGDDQLIITGIGASGGVAVGRARVVRDPTIDIDRLLPGEVLVAAATDPSWTTLFVGAVAVVTDLGGALSHGAIVARELSLPCVTNARTATTMIRTGDLLRVDGTSGTIARLETTLPE